MQFACSFVFAGVSLDNSIHSVLSVRVEWCVLSVGRRETSFELAAWYVATPRSATLLAAGHCLKKRKKKVMVEEGRWSSVNNVVNSARPGR